MRALLGCRILFRYLSLATLVVLLFGCGTESDEEVPEPTQPPTVAISTPDEPIEDEVEGEGEEGDEDGGNIITRSLRTGGSWVWSGLTWVWDRGSDGANALWDGINGASSFLWGTVTGLPSDAWNQIQRFWNWVWGTGFGATVAHAASAVPEMVANLNPIGFVQRLISGVVRTLKVVALVIIAGSLAFVFYKFRTFSFLNRLIFRRAPVRPLQKHRMRQDGASTEHKMMIEIQQAPSSSGVPATSVPQVLASANSTIPGTGVPEMWTRTQIRELRALVSNLSIVSLFELARQRSGGPVNYRELVRTTGLDAVQVGEHFSAFFRRARAIHKDEQWPIEIVPPTDEDSSRAYFVPAPYLDWWFEE